MLSVVAALVITFGAARPAAAEPSDDRLFWVGLAMVPPTYLISVALHEGSHALMTEIVGGDVVEVHLFPPMVNPRINKFQFGWVRTTGLRTKAQRIPMLMAPKITDSLLLGAYTTMVLLDGWPDNKYGQLALTVGATGLFVDYAKDIFLFHKHNDVVKIFNMWCMTGWKQVPARLVYAATIVGFGYVVWRGYEKTFFDDDPMAMPRLGRAPETRALLPILSATF